MNRLLLLPFVFLITIAAAQQKIDFETYNPSSTLVVPQHPITGQSFRLLMCIITSFEWAVWI